MSKKVINIHDFIDACKVMGITRKHLKVLYVPDRAIKVFVGRVNSLVPVGAENDVQLPAIVELIYNQIADGFELKGFRQTLRLGYYQDHKSPIQKENWRRKRFNDRILEKRRKLTTAQFVRDDGPVPKAGRGMGGVSFPRMGLLMQELQTGGLRKTIVERAARRYADANNVRYDTMLMDRYLTYAIMTLKPMGLFHQDGKLIRVKPYRILEEAPEITRDKAWEKLLPEQLLMVDRRDGLVQWPPKEENPFPKNQNG